MSESYFSRDGQTFVGIPLWIADVLEKRDIPVYLFAASHANNETGEFFASNKTIALEMGYHRETVAKSMRRMEKLGIVESTERRRADGYRSSNHRRLRADQPADWIDPRERVRIAREGAQTSANSDTSNSHMTVGGAVIRLSEVQSYDCNLTRPNDIDPNELNEEHGHFSSLENSPTHLHSLKRKNERVSAATDRDAHEFIERYRDLDPSLGHELPDHIAAVYREESLRHDLAPEQILAALSHYVDRKMMNEEEWMHDGDSRFKSPSSFLKSEVKAGVDYASAVGIGGMVAA